MDNLRELQMDVKFLRDMVETLSTETHMLRRHLNDLQYTVDRLKGNPPPPPSDPSSVKHKEYPYYHWMNNGAT